MQDKEKLKQIIVENVFLTSDKVNISDRMGGFRKQGWIFDFRRILMNQKYGNLISKIFWDEYKDQYPFQLCSLEVAGIPLVVNLSNFIFNQGKEDVNGFFIRKSRKKDGLLKMIEGKIEENKNIILVDDIINSGKSFIRQVEVLEELGYKISEIWSVLKMRDVDFYEYFHKKNIKINSIFELNDFTKELKLKNLEQKENIPPEYSFEIEWKFSSPNPNYHYVVHKSNPIMDSEKIYFGSDSGYFWALNQNDGSVAWKFKVGFHARGKSIFSTPILYENLIIFGSYDGNLYALNKNTGKKVWVNFEADWIGSSPTISKKLGLGFVGLEFGLIGKKGGVMAFNLKTGKKVWIDKTTSYTHSSPFYIESTKEVIIGSNDGIVRLYNAKHGKKKWEFSTGEIDEKELYSGFSHLDIKESFAYDKNSNTIFFGNLQKVYAIDRKTGKKKWEFKAEFGFMSTPLFYENKVYFSSLNKHLYCLDAKTGDELWKWNAGARIFASPSLINKSIFIGANTGRMVELNPDTGKEISFITVPERITGEMIYNEKTDKYFLPTFANEIYKLKKK